MPQTRALTFTSPSATPENQGRHGPHGREENSVKQSEKSATGGLLRHTEPPSREAFLFDRIRFKASGRKRVKSPPDSRLHAFGDQAHPSQLILFSNKTGPFDNRPSGHASLPDCFSSHRLAIGKRWGISSPKPLAGDRSRARPVGTKAWRSVGNRKERHLWRDDASFSLQTPSSLRAYRSF